MRYGMLTAVAALLAAAGPAAAAQGNGGPPGGRGGRGPRPGGACAGTADSLTDGQKAQVRSLAAAYTQAHAAQLDSARSIMEAARAAREAGKSQDDVRAIMESGRAINEALAPSRDAFRKDVDSLLTPAQVEKHCGPPAPGGPMGGRRGGPPPGPPPTPSASVSSAATARGA